MTTLPPLHDGWDSLRFDNHFVRHLPADPESGVWPRQVFHAVYSRVRPTPVRAPEVLAHAPDLLAELGLPSEGILEPEAAQVLSGNRILPTMQPYASAYGGHQFGHWAGQLGDGRAIALGELLDRTGARQTVQLKGAGPTPYARSADGRAVLRSSVREFLMSEAMANLGIPTTRALALVSTGDSVVRDMFYDGHPRAEPGAIVVRVAPSFLRFGHYELLAARGDHAGLRQLVDYTLTTHFPELGRPNTDAYLAWLAEIGRRTAELVAAWQGVGFVHGVLNTDNMSVLGLTIDYGPYGWLEPYDPNWTPNTTDSEFGRYRFGAQPEIAWWNLARLGDALLPLVGDVKAIETALDAYPKAYAAAQRRCFQGKLGLSIWDDAEDIPLVQELLRQLTQVETDMTLFFRALADVPLDDSSEARRLAPLRTAYYQPPSTLVQRATLDWLTRYRKRLERESRPLAARRQQMQRSNPKYVLRNYMAQQAIDDAEQGDCGRIHALLALLRKPYDEQPEHAAESARRPEWARHRPGCAALSCSS